MGKEPEHTGCGDGLIHGEAAEAGGARADIGHGAAGEAGGQRRFGEVVAAVVVVLFAGGLPGAVCAGGRREVGVI